MTSKAIVRGLLRRLKSGGYLETQVCGRRSLGIFFTNGKWYEESIACWKSRKLGLGQCKCQTHSPTKISEVSRKDVLREIRKIAKEAIKDDPIENFWLECTLEKLAE